MTTSSVSVCQKRVSLRASAHTGVAISQIFKHFGWLVWHYPIYFGDREPVCGLVRDDMRIFRVSRQSEKGEAEPLPLDTYWVILCTGKISRLSISCLYILHAS